MTDAEIPLLLRASTVPCAKRAADLIERLQTELTAERERAERNEKDAERLDWFEKRADEGGSPALVNDDDGRWAVVEDGMQNVPEGDGASDISTSFWIEAHQWRDTAREAIDAAIDAAKEKP